MVKPLIATLILAGLPLTSYAGGEPITTGSLIGQMIDMQRLAEFPDPAYKTVQFSSYDHRSTLPGGPMWFANSDGFGREPVPNFEGVVKQPDDKGVGEYLICDVEGPGVNPYVSIPFTVASDGTMACRYVMPFEKSLKLVFENHGGQPVEIAGTALPTPYAWNRDRSMHFRARWRVNHDLAASNQDVLDLPFLIANGSGVYVGTAVMLLNPNPVPSSGGNWWGEGDEKVFVDADVRPSTFGTGSEDYFNYAWSSTDIFSFPYCGQTRNDGPANRGFVANSRWQIVDALPFQQRIGFYMELFSHERTEHFSYARIGYHYARPGLMDDHVAITNEDVRKPELPLEWEPAARGGARNSAFYQAEDIVKSKRHILVEEGRLWADGKLCRWNPTDQGEELTFTVAVKENGMYNVAFCFARDARSGRVSLLVDGKKAELGAESGIVDLHEPHRTMLRMEGVKPMSLAAGEHALTLRFEGAHEGAKEAAIGIDFISLQRR